MSPLPEASPDAKRPYKKPEIRIYGDLRTITQNTGSTSPNPDPPPHPGGLKRTH